MRETILVRLPIIIFAIFLSSAEGASSMHLKWEELSTVVDATVSIAMPGGAVIRGKATALESDALVVNVTKTTDPTAYPKGTLRVGRANLRILQMQKKGKKFRAIGTVLGSVGGLAGGSAAYFGIQGGVLSNDNPAAATIAFVAVTAAGSAGGYLAGNAADRRWTTIQIVP